jgi:hypothetical protein
MRQEKIKLSTTENRPQKNDFIAVLDLEVQVVFFHEEHQVIPDDGIGYVAAGKSFIETAAIGGLYLLEEIADRFALKIYHLLTLPDPTDFFSDGCTLNC